MTILMKLNKSLVVSKETRIYQKENIVDELSFYIPIDLFDYIKKSSPNFTTDDLTATCYYVTQTNNAYTEILVPQESDKEDFLLYRLPVTTKFTECAGKLSLVLSFIYIDQSQPEPAQYVLHSGELKDIEVMAWSDYYKFYPIDSLDSIDKTIEQLQNKVQEIKDVEDGLAMDIPDDLTLTDDILQLSREGIVRGKGVELLVPSNYDQEDSSHDGVIDLDEIDKTDDDIDTDNLMFVELSGGEQ